MKHTCLLGVLFLFLFPDCFSFTNESFHWNVSRGYQPFLNAGDNAIRIINGGDSLIFDSFSFPEPSEELSLSFMARNVNGNPALSYSYLGRDGKKYKVKNPHWGFFIASENDTIAVTVVNEEVRTGIESLPACKVDIKESGEGEIYSATLTKDINMHDGFNIWSLSIADGNFTLHAGDHGLKEIAQLPISPRRFISFGFMAAWGEALEVRDIDLSVKTVGDVDKEFDLTTLPDYFAASEDPMEGYWTIFDRELEETLLKPGGEYYLACVKEGEDYLFLYINGATVNKNLWQPGDVKLRLTPSLFPGIYNVEWKDSVKEVLSHEIKAQRGEGNTLLIQFPYQASRLRLRKVP